MQKWSPQITLYDLKVLLFSLSQYNRHRELFSLGSFIWSVKKPTCFSASNYEDLMLSS